MPTTSQTSLLAGQTTKFGIQHSSLDDDDSVLEAKIAKALLSETSTASGVSDFSDLTSTGQGNNPNTTHYLSANFDKNNIQVELHTDFTGRNMAIVGNYVSNADTTQEGDYDNTVVINSSTQNTVTSQVLDDSSAYSNATAKFTITDPYFSTPTFGNNNYNCTFDTSNISKYITTRNVNTNDAHTDKSASITVGDYTSWNTDGSCGSYFVNGTVSFDGTTGEPLKTLYASDASLNLLNKYFSFSLRTDDANAVPDFGRYYATYSEGSNAQSSIRVDICGNSSLVVTTDLTQWANFLEDISSVLNTIPLPTSLNTIQLGNFVGVEKSALDGFLFRIESNARTSELSLVDNSTYTSGLTFDLTNLNLQPKESYILQQSIQNGVKSSETGSLNAVGNSTLSNFIFDDETTYFNRMKINNGSLTLEQTDDVIANRFELVDGIESLGPDDYNTHGLISVYNSNRVSNYNDPANIFPRASRSAVSSQSPILENFAVHYTAEDNLSAPSVGTLTGTDLTQATVTYAVSTLVGQTNTLTNGSNNWSENIIGENGGAIAIVKDSNSTINRSNITFNDNTNSGTYANGELSIIDLTCNKVWSESKVYDGYNDQIIGIAVDIKSSNMPAEFTVNDIRFALQARPLSGAGGLTLASTDTNWTITSPDDFLKSSAGKLGLIADSDIVELLLGGQESTTRSLTIDLKPSVTSVEAHKFTKFHNQIEITYNSAKQITYDDEFEIIAYAKEALTPVEITNYTNLPSNSKLYKRSYTESYKVKIPFRFGNYNNIFLTSPTITQTVEYYVLTDNTNSNNDLPRYFLKDVRDNTNGSIYATISGITGHTSPTWNTTVNFKNNDFRTHHINVQKRTDGTNNWSIQALTDGATVDADLWYNTQSILPTDGIGTFTVSFTLAPDVVTVETQNLYVDMELNKGTSSFTLTGKKFTSSQVNALGNVNLNSFDFGSSTGTAITGILTYSNDNNADPNTQANTTLTGGGYIFTFQGNLYLSIRIIACPNGIFECVKTGGDSAGTTYHFIQSIGSEDSLKLTGSGVYAYGSLRDAIRGTSTATWTLNNNAISGTYYGSTGFPYERLTQVDKIYRPYLTSRGFKVTPLRGLKPGNTVINRTPSTYNLELAGLSAGDRDLYTGIDLENIFGTESGISGVDVTSGGSINTMYMSTSTEQQLTWGINLTYGYYKITDRERTGVTEIIEHVPSFLTKLSDRYGVKIVNTTLNSNAFSYQIEFSTSTSLEFYRHPNIQAPDYSVSSVGYVRVNQYTVAQLTDPTYSKLIGNILQLSYSFNSISNLNGQFCIAPPYLKFTAINPDNVSSLPFNSSGIAPVERYLEVDNSLNSYKPFLSHTRINNITFQQDSTRNYLAYINSPVASVGINVANNKIAVALASGLESNETIVGSYTSYYSSNTISTVDSVTNDYVNIVFSNNKLLIGLNQRKMLDNFFTFDASFNEYNLQTEIASIFISDPNNSEYDGTVDVFLEFLSGDCTRLDLYSLETIRSASGDKVEAVIEKYSSGAGIDNEFFNENIAYGLALPWTTRLTNTLSVQKNSNQALSDTPKTISSLLTELKAQATSTKFDSVSASKWVADSNPGDTLPRLALVPNTSTGSKNLKQLLTLSVSIPRVIIFLTYQDLVRLEDTYGNAKHRVTFSGSTVSQATILEPSVIRPQGSNNYSISNQIQQNYPTITRE